MKDLIMKIILIGFVIFLGATFVYGPNGTTLEKAANTVVGNANTALAEVDITNGAAIDGQ